MSNKTTKNTKAVKATAKKPEVMTYPQVKALTNALFHSGKTKADLSRMIDKLNPEGKKMNPEAKAKWLEEQGNEHCSYAQCKAYAMIAYHSKQPYATISAIISTLDEQSGYNRKTKAEAVVEEANKVASEAKPTKPSKPSSKKSKATQPQA